VGGWSQGIPLDYVQKCWAEKRYPNLVYWHRLDKGGHFAVFEQPEIFLRELRARFSKMRA
jgi:pimeloyl-ACP methyl ester carboxylesterase